MELTRNRYADLYGPTTGDRFRLADTDLVVRIDADLCGGPGLAGDEAVFGGGKVIRESMGQSLRTSAQGAPDLVITGAVVIDHWGIVKADVGIRDGRIVALGKAGNPDTMDGVHPDLVIGPSTEIIAGNGRIVTAGAIDSHVHLICPQVLDTALATGITTIIGGGTGPAEGTKATTVTAAPWYLHRMLTSIDTWPVNVALLGKGNTVSSDAMGEQLRAGASGFKLHEDWGSTPAAIDACLRVCDDHGVQASLHTDTLNEAGFVESSPRSDRRAVDPRLPHRGCGRRPRPRHHHRRRAAERAAVVDQPDPTAHGQHRRRAPRHADRLPPPEPVGARGPRLRREPDPTLDDRRRGRAARHRRDLDDRLRLPGDGTHRRGRHPHLADRPRNEAPARRGTRRHRRRQPPGQAVRGQVHDLPRGRPRSRPARSAPSRSASSPTSSCTTRGSSGCVPTSCSRAA